MLIDHKFETYWCNFILSVCKWYFCKQWRCCLKLLFSVLNWIIGCERLCEVFGKCPKIETYIFCFSHYLNWCLLETWLVDGDVCLIAIVWVVAMHKWYCNGRQIELMPVK